MKIIDNILLSDNVIENFYNQYRHKEFKSWLISILPEIEDCKNFCST